MKWQVDKGADVTAAFQGITTPSRELYDEIHQRGWTVTKVDVKDGQFVATAQNPYGEKVEKSGNTDNTALGNLLVAIMRQETIRFRAHTADLDSPWEGRLGEIAHAYAEAPVYEPKAAGAWKELADDMTARALAIGQQIEIEVTDDPHPYESVADMCEDVQKNRHIAVSRANAQHPLWSVDQVVAYRLVRDVLGHCAAGGDYGWQGENRATQAMMPLLSPNAQKALFTESIGQAAYNMHYRAFGPQKITFLDEDLEDVDEGGVHPSQSIVPGKVPNLDEKKSNERGVADPNAGWESNVEPLPDNAYLWIREQNGLDPLDWQGLRDQASDLDTAWHTHTQPDGQPDLETQKQAVVNSLRAVALAPRKNYRWHATHYQHVAPIPPGVSDPQRFWDTLESHRDYHNQARGLPQGMHRSIFAPEYQGFRQWVKGLNPTLHDGAVDDVARRELFHMLAEEEERIAHDDVDRRLSTMEMEQLAFKGLQKRLRSVTKPSINEKTDFGENTLIAGVDAVDPGVYGSYLASQVRPLGAIGQHANDLLFAARRDVANNRGKGDHWRKEVLRMGIPGIGPKEASYAWLLLQPHSSNLAVISPAILDALGHKPEEASNRDYFKHERELMAGRDAAGYGHIPLGQFSSGLFDYAQGGAGHHQDLTPLRPLHPKPYDQVDWDKTQQLTTGKWGKPYWWEATQEARNGVDDEWDIGPGVEHPKHEIPFKMASDIPTPALDKPGPSYTDVDGETDVGAPGESIMQFIKLNPPDWTTEQIWEQIAEAEKVK